ncbi:DASH complex subunit Dad1 [Paraphaeosphaeria sporulosa]
MSNNVRASTAHPAGEQAPKSYYEQQRELLILEIAQSLNNALHNLNALNRSLEEVIQVGNEFAPVESLWSHFESVMGDQGLEEKETKREGDAEEGARANVEPKLDAQVDGHDRKTHGKTEDVQDEHVAKRSTQSSEALRRLGVNVSRRRRESLWNQAWKRKHE